LNNAKSPNQRPPSDLPFQRLYDHFGLTVDLQLAVNVLDMLAYSFQGNSHADGDHRVRPYLRADAQVVVIGLGEGVVRREQEPAPAEGPTADLEVPRVEVPAGPRIPIRLDRDVERLALSNKLSPNKGL